MTNRDHTPTRPSVPTLEQELDMHRALLDTEAHAIVDNFMDNSTDAILILSNQGYLLRANSACEKLFGWTKIEIMNVHFSALPWIPHDEIHPAVERYQVAMDGDLIIEKETKRITREGLELNILQSVTPIPSLNCYAVIMKDITILKATQAQLNQAEKLSAVGQLAAGLAHEIRNPLTALKGFLKLLPYAPDADAYLDIMSDELGRIELIVSELLVLAKPHILNFTLVDIWETLAEVVRSLQPYATSNGVHIALEVDETDVHLACEVNQFKQLFINLVKNAIEASAAGSKVAVHLTARTDSVDVTVQDNGAGMSKELLEAVGSPFFTTKEAGMGLGLMVCKKIVENHDGTMELTSQAGVGTTVAIVLPRVQRS